MVNKLFDRRLSPRTFIILLAFLAFGGSFYWFQLRPSTIKTMCSAKSQHEVTEASKSFAPDENGRIAREDIEHLFKLQEQLYQFCLREQGL